MSSKKLPRGVPEDQTPIPGGIEQPVPPKFGIERPMDVAGDLPRVCDPLDRSPDANKIDKRIVRYKVYCRNYSPQETRYILGRNGEEGLAEAKALYLKVNGLDALLERLKKTGVTPEAPDIGVTVLMD